MAISVITLCCPNGAYPFVVPVNERNPIQPLMSEGTRPTK
jgi:hypothetical protein